MEIQRLGEIVLRWRPSPLLSFLAPSLSHDLVLARTTTSYIAIANLAIFRRTVTTSRTLRQASTATASAPLQEPSESDDARQISHASTSTEPYDPRADRIKSLLAETIATRTVPSGKNNGASNTLNTRPRSSYASSLRDIQQGYENSRYPLSRRKVSGAIARDMQSPQSVTGTSKAVASDISKTTRHRAVKTIKSRPSLGRTIEVDTARGRHLGRALKMLQVQCNINNVMRDHAAQRFYERPGLKRKRLKSERWRARFKAGFHAMVEKVKAMRRKGW